MSTEETLAKLDAVDGDAIARALSRLLEHKPTVAGMGPLGKLETAEAIAARRGSRGPSGPGHDLCR